jgi:hypothetical protein
MAKERDLPISPGPWAYDERGVFMEDGGGPICWVGDDYARGDNHPSENMRAIAALPDLLTAAIAFAAPPHYDLTEERQMRLAALRAAIEKATGT